MNREQQSAYAASTEAAERASARIEEIAAQFQRGEITHAEKQDALVALLREAHVNLGLEKLSEEDQRWFYQMFDKMVPPNHPENFEPRRAVLGLDETRQ